jgi:hypothetical protein
MIMVAFLEPLSEILNSSCEAGNIISLRIGALIGAEKARQREILSMPDIGAT